MAGNKNSGRRAGKDFGPRVRGLFNIAIKESIANGSLLPKLKKQLSDDPVGTFRAMAAYVPKQVDMSVDQQITVKGTEVTKTDMAIIRALQEAQDEQAENVTH